MPPFSGPQPGVGKFEEVAVNGFPIRVLPKTYKRQPAPRFGEKISTGDLRYQDFNPYESAASYSSFTRGYGLRRYSDLPQTENPEGFYAESDNVDARAPGVCLSPQAVVVDLTGTANDTVTPLWFGEWAPSAGAVTGTQWVMVGYKRSSLSYEIRVWYFTSSTVAVDTGYTLLSGLAGSATTQAANFLKFNVVAAGGQLIIGYGDLGVAQYITTLDASVAAGNVQNTSATSLYIFASTSDRAAVYIAGGTATTNTNTVLSASLTAANPAQSFATAANAVTCGDTNQAITGLAPGGGIGGVLVFVGKTGQLGMIDTSSAYRTLMPFQQKLTTNCRNQTWWLPGKDPSTVGTVLTFPIGRSLWSYSTTGGMRNMAAAGQSGFRPITARGVVSAIQPTQHFLYYIITNQAERTGYVIANDGTSGANHTYRAWTDLTSTSILAGYAMGVTSLFGTNPLLYLGRGNIDGDSLEVITLPADGDWPPADSNCRYDTGSSNTLLLPDIDLGFPDEDKIPTFLRLVADNLESGAQYIVVEYATEGSSTYSTLGTYFISPIQDIPFPSMSFKRISLRLTFRTNDSSETPILNAISLRASINPKQYTLWSFIGAVPSGSTKIMTDSPYNANTVINSFWDAYKDGTPVAYADRWNKQWLVRILDFREDETYQENLQTPGTACNFTLLELYGTGLESVWDGANTIWDNPNMTWG